MLACQAQVSTKGFFFADWPSYYLWLDTLAGGGERICVSERGKFTRAQRSARVDRGEGSSEFWALCYVPIGVVQALNSTESRAGFSDALSRALQGGCENQRH